jgi:sigma-54 specific flagellar transcriptional regulator A
VKLQDTLEPKARPANSLVLDTNFYYQDVLELLYRLQLGRNRGAVPVNEPLVGVSSAVAELRRLSAQVADKAVTVLITGPSGAGKEVVARSLHDLSSRREAPFVPINCGAIPRELLESELFGHERGAFTGAISSRAGRFELAEGGTLFLDEIGDMPLEMQVKILRVIQERQFERVGSDKTRTADVRIIAATHRNLEAMISAGQFREDLYYRINVFPLNVPALAERREDIPHLIRVLSKQLEQEGLGRLRLADSALRSLSAHAWSGNIRELANLLERLVIMYPDTVVGFADLPENYRHGEDGWRPEPQPAVEGQAAIMADGVPKLPVAGIDMKAYFQTLERQWIIEALEAHAGVISKAATHLGLRRTTLIEKMRKLEIKA